MSQPYTKHPHPEHWEAIRLGAMARDRGCRVCGSMKNLEAHHRTYERFGRETLADVTTLCRACHELFTRAHRNTRTLVYGARR
jgi:5-methylcytosine-specific restriction endonuclease McrA